MIDVTHMNKALNLIDVASAQAEAKHGTTELGGKYADLDKKLRIMVEEVGEVAEVIEDLTVCADRWPGSSSVTQHRRHLAIELAQVGACCQRWLAEIAAEHPEAIK